MNVNELVSKIQEANSAYYTPGSVSDLTDVEYDALKQQLKSIDPTNPILFQIGALYNKTDLGNKVKHVIPMGSLDNTEDGINGYSDWYNSIANDRGLSIVASLKIDGCSVALSYKNGKLVRAATRGNGEYGDDITANVARFKDVPHTIDYIGDLEIRGEAILYIDEFNTYCVLENIEDKSNPRNVGNGIIGRLDGKYSDLMRLMAFNVVGMHFDTVIDKFKFLKKLNFNVVPYRCCQDVEDMLEYYDDMLQVRKHMEFEIDGIVAVFNDVSVHNEFITKDVKSLLRPKFARAIKFPAPINTTVVKDVIISIGHTGAIIPTAVLEEVRIGGVNVSRVLLNNWDEIHKLDVAIGDTVKVGLAGDIIPKVYEVINRPSNRLPITEPKTCPSCGAPTTRMLRDKDGAVTYCSNSDCESIKFEKIGHWIGSSKTGVGILGIGDAIIKGLWDNGIVKDPADLYLLTEDKLSDLSLNGVKVGKSRAKLIIDNITNSKNIKLETFLGSIGVELLGRRRAAMFIEAANGALDSIESWIDGTLESIELPGLGDTIRSTIVTGLEKNKWLIQKLLSVGVRPFVPRTVSNVVVVGDGTLPLSGYSFCFTGTRDCLDEVKNLGGEIKSGVSKNLTFLVQADALSSSKKTQKAESYGTKVISIDALKQVISGEIDIKSLL